MRLGVDFDNTIVCYDALFHQVALERGLIPDHLPLGKSSVRDYLRHAGREEAWTELQGLVYGARLHQATAFPGVDRFFRACRNAGVPVAVISHKTRFPFRGAPHDLHAAAHDWLEHQGFFDPAGLALPRDHVFFEPTKEAKLDRIGRFGCTHFMDDLPEFLAEPGFPSKTLRLLFDPHQAYPDDTGYLRVRSWTEITELFAAELAGSPELAALRRQVLPYLRATGAATEVLLQPLAGGANNRVLRVRGEGLDRVLKAFFRHPDDPRDRFHAERAFYTHLWRHGVRCTPEPCGWDEPNRLGLFSFVSGRKLRPEEITAEPVGQALEFILAANQPRANLPPESMPLAAEACFSIAQHLALVDQRVARLHNLAPETALDAEAAAFVREELGPAWSQIRTAVSTSAGKQLHNLLPPSDRCLSPSDFGFHNALLGADNRLRFFDFEYAGWDDPAKLICDFFCQPQLPVSPDAWNPFVLPLDRAFGAPGALAHRASQLLPVYQVKWCCILLNDFVRADHARRQFALGPSADPERKRTQLDRARLWLARPRNLPR